MSTLRLIDSEQWEALESELEAARIRARELEEAAMRVVALDRLVQCGSPACTRPGCEAARRLRELVRKP